MATREDEIKSMIGESFFDSQTRLENCFEAGMEMGYIEAQKNNQYSIFWTCGMEDSEADQVFNNLLAEYG